MKKIGTPSNLLYLKKDSGWSDPRLNKRQLEMVLKQQENGQIELNYDLLRKKKVPIKGGLTSHKIYVPGLKLDRLGRIQQNTCKDDFVLGYHNSKIDESSKTLFVQEAKTLMEYHFLEDKTGPLKKGIDILQDSIGPNSEETKLKLIDTLSGLENLNRLMLFKIIFDAAYAKCETVCFASKETCPIITQNEGRIIKEMISRKIITGFKKTENGYEFKLNTSAILNYLEKRKNESLRQNPAFKEINEECGISRNRRINNEPTTCVENAA